MPKQKQFKPNQSAENKFAKALRQVARVSTHVVEAHIHGDYRLWTIGEMNRELEKYSKLITPWAARQSAKMLEAVSKKNKTAFAKQSKLMGKLLRANVAEGPVAVRAAALMAEQVALIQSIPIRAGERVQRLASEAFFKGTRSSDIAAMLEATGRVSDTDAERIARTEVARSNAAFIQARAEAVGSKQYIWRNSGDAAVRHAHKFYHGRKLDGMVFSWDDPPTLDDGTTGHPGTFPNCRCYAEPFFPKE